MEFPDKITELLKSYRAGSISDEDRHLLERIALDDQLLFEAMEGYHISGSNEVDEVYLNSLKADIKRSERTKKVMWRKYLAIAASVVILSVIGFQILNKQNHGNRISQVGNRDIKDAKTEWQEEERKDENLDETRIDVEEPKFAAETKDELVLDDLEKEVLSKPNEPKVAMKAKKTEVKNTNIVRGKILNIETSSPIAKANILNYDDQIIYQTDHLGNFEITNDSTQVSLLVSSSGYNDRGVRLNSGEHQIYIWPQEIEDREVIELDGVPLTEPMLESADMIEVEGNMERKKAASYHPSMSYENLEFWIEKNKNIPLEAFRENFHGEVKIYFKVNSDGQLSDFHSDHEQCEDCVTEAIRLLSKSGKWRTNPKGLEAQGYYIIKFD